MQTAVHLQTRLARGAWQSSRSQKVVLESVHIHRLPMPSHDNNASMALQLLPARAAKWSSLITRQPQMPRPTVMKGGCVQLCEDFCSKCVSNRGGRCLV